MNTNDKQPTHSNKGLFQYNQRKPKKATEVEPEVDENGRLLIIEESILLDDYPTTTTDF